MVTICSMALRAQTHTHLSPAEIESVAVGVPMSDTDGCDVITAASGRSQTAPPQQSEHAGFFPLSDI